MSLQLLSRQRSVRIVIALLGIGLLLFLGLYNQPYYPKTWQDEGFVLQGALNLARYGQYAMKSSEGFRVLDQPLIANGPGVVLPIAAAFYLLGTGLMQARMVMIAFLVIVTILFFILAKRLYGATAAIFSVLLLLAVPGEGYLLYGRHALGNIPALGYFILGYLSWLSFLERQRVAYGIGAGILFGLAAVTKGQYILLIPMMAVLYLVDWLYYKQIGFKKIAVLFGAFIAILGIWYIIQVWIVGLGNIGQHFEAIRSSSSVTVFAFRLMRIPGNLWYLARSGLAIYLLPGCLYVAWCCRKRNLDSLRQVFLLIFVAGWLGWYAFVSVGLARYTFDGYAIGMLFAGKFIVDAVKSLRVRGTPLVHGWSGKLTRATALVIVAVMSVVAVLGLTGQVKRILTERTASPQRFAKYLLENVDPQTVIESGEWEIDALADLNFHHPTNDWVDRYTAQVQFGEVSPAQYNPKEYKPDYLIDGPFSKWIGLYERVLAEGCCTLAVSIGRGDGQYDLYHYNSEN